MNSLLELLVDVSGKQISLSCVICEAQALKGRAFAAMSLEALVNTNIAWNRITVLEGFSSRTIDSLEAR